MGLGLDDSVFISGTHLGGIPKTGWGILLRGNEPALVFLMKAHGTWTGGGLPSPRHYSSISRTARFRSLVAAALRIVRRA